MIKLVAFDWNGTLFADTKAIFESDNAAFKVINLKPVSFSTFQKYFDVPVKKYFLALGVPEEIIDKKAPQITQAFHSAYEPRVDKVRTRAYAKSLLKRLSENKVESVIFSNHILEQIKRQLKRLRIEKYFIDVIANSHIETVLNGRNKKEKLDNYIKEKNILPTEVLVIGDTLEEIDIAKELGCKSAAITQGNCSTQRLKAAQPDYLINSLKEVISLVR